MYSLTRVVYAASGGEYNPKRDLAQTIDTKIDDGLPQTGKVVAMDGLGIWASGGPLDTSQAPVYFNFYSGDMDLLDDQSAEFFGPVVAGDGMSTPATQDTCYDNNNVPGGTEKYTMSVNGGRGANCSLSFRME